jgi:hypothetical protein
MIKLKDIIKESFTWERKSDGSLPTLADYKEAKEATLNEDDYATQYVDMIDDITKEVNRKSSKIVKLLNKQDKITGTKNARVYNQAVDKHFRKFIVAIMKITAKIED